MATYETLQNLADKIVNPTKMAGALSLLQSMQSEVQGLGDNPIRWRPSFVRVVQGTTDTSQVKGKVGVGDIIWGDEVIGDSLEILPLMAFNTRQMWDPDPNVQIVKCFSPDAKVGSRFGECKTCKFAEYDAELKKVDCTLAHTVYVLRPDFSSIGQVSFSKTSYSNGTAWVKMMRARSVPPYVNSFKLKSKKSTQYKQVSLLEAEGQKDAFQYGEGEVDFVKELFTFLLDSRKEYLAVWHEEHKNRATAPALPSADEHKSIEMKEAGTVSAEAEKYDM